MDKDLKEKLINLMVANGYQLEEGNENLLPFNLYDKNDNYVETIFIEKK